MGWCRGVEIDLKKNIEYYKQKKNLNSSRVHGERIIEHNRNKITVKTSCTTNASFLFDVWPKPLSFRCVAMHVPIIFSRINDSLSVSKAISICSRPHLHACRSYSTPNLPKSDLALLICHSQHVRTWRKSHRTNSSQWRATIGPIPIHSTRG